MRTRRSNSGSELGRIQASGGGAEGKELGQGASKREPADGHAVQESDCLKTVPLCVIVPLDRSGQLQRGGTLQRFLADVAHSRHPEVSTTLEFDEQQLNVFAPARCPMCRVKKVGEAMGLKIEHETKVKHRTVQGLGPLVGLIKRLPLSSVMKEGDPLNVVGALANLADLLASHLTSVRARHAKGSVVPSSALDAGDPDELSATRDRMARLLFCNLHSHLFPQEPTAEDRKLHARLSRLSWIEPRHLEVPDNLANTHEAQRVSVLMGKIHTLHTPEDMLETIGRAFRVVTDAALQLASKSSATRRDFGADDAFPLFAVVVLRARPPMLASVMDYTELFTPRKQLLSERGYALTQLRLIVSFAETLQGRSLAGLEPGEWERRMEAPPEQP